MQQSQLNQQRSAWIKQTLLEKLQARTVDVLDESQQHAGHAGARSGLGHFAVTVVSPQFSGQSAIQRHRLVYAALGDAMRTDIHALSINALAPEEL